MSWRTLSSGTQVHKNSGISSATKMYMYKGQLFWTFCRGSYMQMRCDQTLQKQSLVLLCQRLVIPGTWLVTFQLFFRWAVKLCDSWEYHFFCFAFRGLFKIFSAIWNNGKVISFSQCKTFGFMKDKKGKKKKPCDLFQSTFLFEFNSIWERQGESLTLLMPLICIF